MHSTLKFQQQSAKFHTHRENPKAKYKRIAFSPFGSNLRNFTLTEKNENKMPMHSTLEFQQQSAEFHTHGEKPKAKYKRAALSPFGSN